MPFYPTDFFLQITVLQFDHGDFSLQFIILLIDQTNFSLLIFSFVFQLKYFCINSPKILFKIADIREMFWRCSLCTSVGTSHGYTVYDQQQPCIERFHTSSLK